MQRRDPEKRTTYDLHYSSSDALSNIFISFLYTATRHESLLRKHYGGSGTFYLWTGARTIYWLLITVWVFHIDVIASNDDSASKQLPSPCVYGSRRPTKSRTQPECYAGHPPALL